MYRFLTLIALFLISIPIGLSVTGCAYDYTQYCSNTGYGEKLTQVVSIDLEPKLTGISLSYGQTQQIPSPTAYNCVNTPISVSSYVFGSDNKNLVDLSPSGTICAGTWNKTSSGGIADYTICTPPASSGTAHVTAQGGGATSNAITVYIHPPVTSATLDIGNSCVSQNLTEQLDSTAYTGGSTTAPFCAPYGNTANSFNSCGNNPANGVPDCICNLGPLAYAPQGGGIVTIDQNGVATAHLPGTTLIAATISSVSLNAGYFATCPPAKITLSVPPPDIGSSGVVTVTATVPVPVTATVYDTNTNLITGLNLTYTSSNPAQITTSSTGSVTTTFPGVAEVSAVCEPPICNPSPTSKVGQYSGTGLPVTSSNTLTFQAPGNSSNYLWVGSSSSPYFTHFDLSTSTMSTPVKMPYTPNSMVLDSQGSALYFGSYRELMIYSALGNVLSKEDTTAPGVVLGVSPSGTSLVICDQLRQLIYLYSPSSGIVSTIGGVATHVVFSADSSTAYITGPNSLYVNNTATGWSSYTLPTAQTVPSSCPLDNTGLDPYCSPDVTATFPGVGAFLSGTSTTARSYCFSAVSNLADFPATTDIDPATDQLVATANGAHVIGATAAPAQLTDIFTALPTGPCPDSTTPLKFSNGFIQLPLPVAGPTEIDQVVASYDSSIAFVTYSGTAGAGAVLPAYAPSATPLTAGTLTAVPLTGGATAPLAGVFSPNNLQFFVGTSGDDLIHVIDVKTLTDSSTINPSLPDLNGNPVAAEFLAVKPRPIA